MTLPDSAFNLIIKAAQSLSLFVYIVGLAVAAWAYWRSRKIGYLLVTAYFLVAVFNTFLVPALNRMIATRWDAQRKSELSPQAHEEFMKEYSALLQKYYPPGNATPGTINIKLPISQIILVVGVWMLARRETGRIAEKEGAGKGSPPLGSETNGT
ncbi:MAG: hypothetical protein ABSA47_19880 [Verrucomicrobiota bacterium]|jgi:hypothetical protein